MTRSILGYLGLRVLLFLAVWSVTYWLGLDGFAGALVALLVSGVLALPLARRQRDDVVRDARTRRGR